MNDVTHTCFYDIPLLGSIPNLIYLAPTCREEYFAMLRWGLSYREHPVAIRVPVNGVVSRPETKADVADWSVPRYEVARTGKRVAVLGLGSYFQLGEQLCDALAEKGLQPTLVNPRIISSLDMDTLRSLEADHELVVTLESGQAEGGWGEKIARHFGETPVKVMVRGERKQFEDRYDLGELLKANRLTVPQLVEDVLRLLGK